jgi:hypothetical protein
VENLSPPAKTGTASAVLNREALDLSLEHFKAEFPGVLQDAHHTLFSNIAIIITPAHLAQMHAVIAAVETLVTLPAWQQQVLGEHQQDAPSNKGVFFGYDFHLNEEGAHLIEINTNAGGAFLSELFQQSQKNTALPGQALAMDHLSQAYVEMFRREWQLQRGDTPLRTIAIVDEAPQTQYFYPEFILARRLFEEAGIKAFIADPADFDIRPDGVYLQGNKIDLLYNRLTDFSLEQYPVLLSAYKTKLLVLTPHPRAYALYADKRNLVLLTDSERLRTMGADEATIATLQSGVPETRLVQAEDEQQWWKARKEWFFKPATGYGGKGSYRGDKLTQRVFGELLQGGYVAQRKAMPGEVLVNVADGEPAVFKYDVRCYVYEGQVQLVMARLYQGQTTNFRTVGGGFALVRVDS